jgi:hypothetical protein
MTFKLNPKGKEPTSHSTGVMERVMGCEAGEKAELVGSSGVFRAKLRILGFIVSMLGKLVKDLTGEQ